MIDTVRGVLRVRKWPKKRGTPTSERQLFWIDWFRQANLLAKYADPMSMARAILMTKDTGLYPRDVLLKAMRGRLYTWADETGWRWYPVAAIGDISETLDVLAQTVGDILVRATDRWRTPPAGTPGDVLTVQGANQPPAWQPVVVPPTSFAGAMVSLAGNFSVSHNSLTIVPWTLEQEDVGGWHESVTNPSRLTVPAGVSHVVLNANVNWQNLSSGRRLIQFLKNGSQVAGTNGVDHPNSSNINTQVLMSAALAVVAGDYFELQVLQARGGNLNMQQNFALTYFAARSV